MKSDLKKGQSQPLLFTEEGRGRISVGLSWDIEQILPERPDAFISEMEEGLNSYGEEIDIQVGFTSAIFDMDLVCLIFNASHELIDAVSPAPTENVDLSGAIYHSGDDTRGVSSGDDEQISAELLNLPENIHTLVFMCIIQNKKMTFAQIPNVRCIVADGKTNSDLCSFALKNGGSNTAAIMFAIYRDAEGWRIKSIEEYRVDKEIDDWGAEAQKYIRG
jgi:tellurium resistance protein TerZ